MAVNTAQAAQKILCEERIGLTVFAAAQAAQQYCFSGKLPPMNLRRSASLRRLVASSLVVVSGEWVQSGWSVCSSRHSTRPASM